MSPADALDRYFAAWNDHDPDAVVRSLTGWWSYEDATTGGPLTRDALAANEAALLAGFPTCISTRSAWLHQRRHGHCPVPDAGTNTGPMRVGPGPAWR
jgi:hypothetical protein